MDFFILELDDLDLKSAYKRLPFICAHSNQSYLVKARCFVLLNKIPPFHKKEVNS